MCERAGLKHSRASFLGGLSAVAGLTLAVPSLAFAQPASNVFEQIWIIGGRAKRVYSAARQIWIVDAHSNRPLIAYITIDGLKQWAGTPQFPGINDINFWMRDTHVNVEAPHGMDIMVIEAALETQQELYRRGFIEPMIITSGFRTVETNSVVGGARYGYHPPGKALDIVVPNTPYDQLFDAARTRRYVGGIGGYADSHLHIDSGPRRYWNG